MRRDSGLLRCFSFIERCGQCCKGIAEQYNGSASGCQHGDDRSGEWRLIGSKTSI